MGEEWYDLTAADVTDQLERNNKLARLKDTAIPDAFSDQAIVASRGWFTDETGRLTSVTGSRTVWPARNPLEATCALVIRHGQGDAIPSLRCLCGIYGLKDQAAEVLRLGASLHYLTQLHMLGVHVVTGKVSLWGRVIECEKGWRAQYAYPHSLVLPPQASHIAHRLREEYLVPVEVAE